MQSAGLLMFRRAAGGVEVFLVHPGGPYFANKDAGYWTIPKGLVEEGEIDLDAARREFEEETSIPVAADRSFRFLGDVRQKGGKQVRAWAFEGECDPQRIRSNAFEMEWPPHSGRLRSFPEIDRAAWFPLDAARTKINEAQSAFLDRLLSFLEETTAGKRGSP